MRGIGAAGSAFDWQSKGQGFEPPMLHQGQTTFIRVSSVLFLNTVGARTREGVSVGESLLWRVEQLTVRRRPKGEPRRKHAKRAVKPPMPRKNGARTARGSEACGQAPYARRGKLRCYQKPTLGSFFHALRCRSFSPKS